MSYAVAMLSVHTSPLALPGSAKDAGGMNVYICELALELGRSGIAVDIFTRRTQANQPEIVVLGPRVRVIHIEAGPAVPVSKHNLYPYLSAFTRHIEEFSKREQRSYDLLHSHYWLSGVAAQRLARRWHIPHVTMFHTLAHLKQLANPNEAEPTLRLEMEQQLIQHADRIIAATQDERSQIIHHCGAIPERVEVIPCGVDLSRFVAYERQQARKRLNWQAEQPVLLFVGRLDPFKGPDMLLKVASLMQTQAQVVVVGGNAAGDPEIEQLRQLARELGIQQRVRFLGALPQEELPLIYSAVDVTVMPSYHESFGMVAVESLACGTPVVATRAGGLLTVIRHGETGYLVPRAPDLFAACLDGLLNDPATLQAMGAAARPSILRYSWQSVASLMSTIYEDALYESATRHAQAVLV
ncbi:MAG TPA: glycosyltransferase [Ktedonobacteraceae bacterium]